MAKSYACQGIFLLFVYLKKKKSWQGHQAFTTHQQVPIGCNHSFLSKGRTRTKTSSGGRRQSPSCKWCEYQDRLWRESVKSRVVEVFNIRLGKRVL